MRTIDRRRLLTGAGFERGAAYVQTDADSQQLGCADGQARQIFEWAVRHQSQIRNWYIDLGVDGDIRLDERPDGARLIEAVRRGEVEYVVVSSYGRLGRSPEQMLAVIQQLVQLKVLVIVTDGDLPLDLQLAMDQVGTANPMGRDGHKTTLN